MTLLDKLQALQASPGPWKMMPIMTGCTYIVGEHNDYLGKMEANQVGNAPAAANAKLASLAPHIPALAKELKNCSDMLDGIAENSEELHAVRHARTALKELEEALD